MRARISSSTTTTFGEKFSKFKQTGGEIDLAKFAEIELPQAAGAGAGAGIAADEESWREKVLQVVEEAWPASGGSTFVPPSPAAVSAFPAGSQVGAQDQVAGAGDGTTKPDDSERVQKLLEEVAAKSLALNEAHRQVRC